MLSAKHKKLKSERHVKNTTFRDWTPNMTFAQILVFAAAWNSVFSAVTPKSEKCPEVAFDRRCSCSYFDVMCESLGITKLSVLFPLPSDARQLSVSQNELIEIAADALAGAANITSLTLKEDKIVRFDITALAPLIELEQLDLSFNQLKEFDLATMELPKLQYLDLTGNEIVRFQLNPSVTSLKSVVIEDNQLKSLDHSFPVPNVIERAKFSRNKLGNNLEFLRNLPNVITLWLSDNNISVLHEHTFHSNKKIQFLRLDGNSIEKLQCLKDLPEITGLNITSNQITHIPVSIFKNTSSLQYLYISDNNISETEFLKVLSSKLFSLDLSRNKISYIPVDAFKGKDNLRRLSIDYNSLDDITFVSEVKNLEKLLMNNNNLQYVPNSIFKNSKIQHINLSNNKVENLDFVKYSEYLKDLYLSNNSIAKINTDIFLNSKIERLHLSNNRLTNINFVRKLQSLKDLYVHNNLITAVPENIFIDNGDLEKVDFTFNSLSNLDFVFYISKIRILLVTDCSVKSRDDSPLKCSRNIEVITNTRNTTLSFIQSTQELWDECYNSHESSKRHFVAEWNVEQIIALMSLLCLAILLLIILIEITTRGCKRKLSYYDFLAENERKMRL